MNERQPEHVFDALIRRSLTRELITDQRNRAKGIANKDRVRQIETKRMTLELDQRLARLQLELDQIKKDWEIV